MNAPAVSAPAAVAAPGPVKPAAPTVPAPKVEAPKAPAPAEAKKPVDATAAPVAEEPQHTLKVNGKERKVNTAELVRLAQLNENAELTTQQARAVEKRANDLLEAFKADPRAATARALKEFGGKDLLDLAVEVLSEEQSKLLERERTRALSPEQRELEELRRDKATREETTKKSAETERAKAVETATTQIRSAAIDTLDLVPQQFREVLAGRVLDAWMLAIEHHEEFVKAGVKVTPQLVAERVLKEHRGLSRQMLAAAKDEELDEYLDPAVRERLLKKLQRAAVTAHPALASTPQSRGAEKKDDERPRLTQAQLLRKGYFPKSA